MAEWLDMADIEAITLQVRHNSMTFPVHYWQVPLNTDPFYTFFKQ